MSFDGLKQRSNLEIYFNSIYLNNSLSPLYIYCVVVRANIFKVNMPQIFLRIRDDIGDCVK
jgi:hypothetical protein